MYQSTAKLFIKNVYNGNVVAAYGNEESLASESGYSNPLFNYQEIMRSELVARHSYKALQVRYAKQLEKMGISNERQWIASFGKLMDTKVIPSTDIIQLSFRWSEKASADEVTHLILDSLRMTNLDILRGVTIQQREFLDSQLDKISRELLEVRTQIKNFKLANRAVDLDDETTELVRRRVELQQQLSSLHSHISYNRNKAKELVRILGVRDAKDAMLANSIGNDPYLQTLNQQLAELQKEYQGMSAKFTDEYPPVQALKQKIEAVTRNIESRQKKILGDYVVSKGIYNKASSDIVTDLARVQADAISSEAQYKALQEGIERLKLQEASMPAKKLQLDELEKKELALANAYDSVKKKQMEARIQENAIVDNIIVLSEPTPGKLDIKQPMLLCFGFLALGLMAGIVLAWLKEGIRDEWTDTEEVERKTGKPVLGELPWRVKGSGWRSYSDCQSQPELVRTYDNLAHNLVNRSYLENTKVISFCSLSTNRKESPVVSQLALSLAEAGHRVLLIDADMQQPRRHMQYFDCEKEPATLGLDSLIPEINRQLRTVGPDGISEPQLQSLASRAMTRVFIPGSTVGHMASLDYLSSQEPQERIYDFLASPGFKTLVQHLKAQYDFVLIDTPAMPIHFPEVDTVTSLSEGVVLLSPFAAKRSGLIRHVRRLQTKGTNSLGILVRSRQTA
ncbi:MAG TPA: AAA family ATPase [Oculatellaceae cyanobacterium]